MANVSEGNSLLHDQEKDVNDNACYQGEGQRPHTKATQISFVAMHEDKREKRDKDNNPIDALICQVEKIKVSILAQDQHPFRVFKHQLFEKLRYPGLKENTLQISTLFSMTNFWMVRRKKAVGQV